MSAEFEHACATTCLLVDGAPTDPRTAAIRLSENQVSQSVQFEMRIGSVILVHELEQAGVTLEADSLKDFVQQDLHDHGQLSLQAYLGIVQAVASPRKGASVMLSPCLWIKRVEAVHLEKDVLVISGEAEE